MSRRLDDLLREVMREMADQGRPPQYLADKALARVRRQRRLSLLTAVLAAASVIVAVLVIPVLLRLGDGGGLPPVASATPTSRPPVSRLTVLSFVAYRAGQQQRYVLDPAAGRYVPAATYGATFTLPSPDGHWLLLASQGPGRGYHDYRLLDLSTGRVGKASIPDGAWYPVWSEDSREILTTSVSSQGLAQFHITDARTLRTRTAVSGVRADAAGPFVWAPRGNGVQVQLQEDVLGYTRNGEATGVLARYDWRIETALWSPGHVTAVVARPGSVDGWAGQIWMPDDTTVRDLPMPVLRSEVLGWLDNNRVLYVARNGNGHQLASRDLSVPAADSHPLFDLRQLLVAVDGDSLVTDSVQVAGAAYLPEEIAQRWGFEY